MVNTWKDGRVKIYRVSHQVSVEMIALVMEIPQQGINFYKDNKMLANVVKDFVKDEEERKKLVKVETYYKMDSIKKLWRYVLGAVRAHFAMGIKSE